MHFTLFATGAKSRIDTGEAIKSLLPAAYDQRRLYWNAKRLHNVLHFDGENDFVALNNPPFFQGSFTVEGWIKPEQKVGVIFHVRDRTNDLFTAVSAEVMPNGK